MTRRWMLLLLSVIIAFSGVAFTRNPQPASATNPPPGPDRYTFITVQYIAYEWSLATWKDQVSLCSIIVDHEGIPYPGEIYRDCGETIYDKWIIQEPCMATNKRDCTGFYIHPLNTHPAEKEIPAELEPATVWVSLEGCEPVLSTSTNICERSEEHTSELQS